MTKAYVIIIATLQAKVNYLCFVFLHLAVREGAKNPRDFSHNHQHHSRLLSLVGAARTKCYYPRPSTVTEQILATHA